MAIGLTSQSRATAGRVAASHTGKVCAFATKQISVKIAESNLVNFFNPLIVFIRYAWPAALPASNFPRVWRSSVSQ